MSSADCKRIKAQTIPGQEISAEGGYREAVAEASGLRLPAAIFEANQP
jgi:hypothetical protein